MTDDAITYRDMASAAASVLAGWHDEKTGTWPDCWWQSANALEALIDYFAATEDCEHAGLIGLTYPNKRERAA